MKSFQEKIGLLQEMGKFVCIGLDPQIKENGDLNLKHYHIPSWIMSKFSSPEDTIFYFNKKIIQATHDLVCAYKPNSAFYEAFNRKGMSALAKTVKFIHQNYPQIPIILDAKRGDVGNTNFGYVKSAFDNLCVDAITINPWPGKIALLPFLERKDKGIIVWVKTSNEGAEEFQNLETSSGEKVYEVVARKISTEWNFNGNCGVVAGATYPQELKRIRKIVGNMQILIPGIGTQGGDLKATIKNGKNSKGKGMIITLSRSVIYASQKHDFSEKAREQTVKIHKEITTYLS